MKTEVTREEYVKALQVVDAYRSQSKNIWYDATEQHRIISILDEVSKIAEEYSLMEGDRRDRKPYIRSVLQIWLVCNTRFTTKMISELVGLSHHTSVCHAMKQNRELDKDSLYNSYREMILPRLKRYEKGVFELDRSTEG